MDMFQNFSQLPSLEIYQNSSFSEFICSDKAQGILSFEESFRSIECDTPNINTFKNDLDDLDGYPIVDRIQIMRMM
eukprot:EST43102.1 Hypothetical protein SS50377_17259 [Spironucleus salmonicida]